MTDVHYILAASRSWYVSAFERVRPALPGTWSVVVDARDLAGAVERLSPRYVFFPHWSHLVPESVLERTECVCFHMTDLPYGRGGSPLQNLVQRGHDVTRLTALRMEPALDAGPIYMKRDLSLEGAAHEVFSRTAALTMDMIVDIVREEPEPRPQQGEPVHFLRRTPDQSRLPEEGDLRVIYDHIRMLDAEGYPRAYLDHGHWRATFRDARAGPETVEAHVTFTMRSDTR